MKKNNIQKILMVFIILNLFYNLFPANVRNKKKKYKIFNKYNFKILKLKNWKLSELDTRMKKIKVLRWKNKKINAIIEIRCAFDFVHLDKRELVRIYKMNTKDFYKELNITRQGGRNVKNKWVWIVFIKGVLLNGENYQGRVFIIRHKNIAYFITALYQNNTAVPNDVVKMINSIIYL